MAADTEPYRKLLVRLSYDKPTNVALGTQSRSGIKPSLRLISLENGNNAEDEQRLLA
jgi:hypothetical protein